MGWFDDIGKGTAQQALTTAAPILQDLEARALGILNLQTDKIIVELKPTIQKVNALLDNINALVTDLRLKGIKALL